MGRTGLLQHALNHGQYTLVQTAWQVLICPAVASHYMHAVLQLSADAVFLACLLLLLLLLLPCAQLEFIGGEVWANVWQTNCIARICPETGKVKGWLLMHGLRQSLQDRNLASNGMDVLNGERP